MRLAVLAIALAIGSYFTLRLLVGLPSVGGPHPVGQRSVVITDQKRIDPWSGETGRQLLIYAFYPAVQARRPVSYFPNVNKLAKNFAGADSLLVRLLPVFLIPSASADVPMAATPERLPVVLFSPGGHSAVFFYRTLLEDLASYGYLVLAVEPTYEGVGQVFPDGHIVEPLADREQPEGKDPASVEQYYRKCVDARATDLAFVAEQLADDTLSKICPEWFGRIDARRIATLGHSIGGIAAVEAARREPRIAAAVNLDGHFKSAPCLPDTEPVARHAALLIIEDESPQMRAAARQPQDAEAADALAKWQAREAEIDNLLASIFRRHDKLLLDNTQHSDFSDQPFFYPQWQAAARNENRQRLQTIRDKLRDFLDNDPAARQAEN